MNRIEVKKNKVIMQKIKDIYKAPSIGDTVTFNKNSLFSPYN